MRSRKVPSYPLSTYKSPMVAEHGIFVERFEVLETQLNRPAGVHRHDHFELFWLRGPAVHVNDFECYALSAQTTPDPTTFEPIIVYGRSLDMIGEANSAAEGQVGA